MVWFSTLTECGGKTIRRDQAESSVRLLQISNSAAGENLIGDEEQEGAEEEEQEEEQEVRNHVDDTEEKDAHYARETHSLQKSTYHIKTKYHRSSVNRTLETITIQHLKLRKPSIKRYLLKQQKKIELEFDIEMNTVIDGVFDRLKLNTITTTNIYTLHSIIDELKRKESDKHSPNYQVLKVVEMVVKNLRFWSSASPKPERTYLWKFEGLLEVIMDDMELMLSDKESGDTIHQQSKNARVDSCILSSINSLTKEPTNQVLAFDFAGNNGYMTQIYHYKDVMISQKINNLHIIPTPILELDHLRTSTVIKSLYRNKRKYAFVETNEDECDVLTSLYQGWKGQNGKGKSAKA
ncbi:hypothetical protein INT45_008414, partial [Circinella minor]